jgi:hypothetical protein
VLLKEYGPSVAITDTNSLKGTTISLKGFESAPDLVELKPESKPEEDKQWNADQRAAQKAKDKFEIKIGNMRNAFGMVMSHVYALNDPGAWLVPGLKYDLEAQGFKVVDVSQADVADVVIGGKIQLCRVDMYMTVNSSLLVDLTVQLKTGAARQRQIHTHGATAAMLASEGEYFHALRDARQKFSILVTKEIAQAMSAGP